METEKTQPTDKGIHSCPSADCAYYIWKYALCSHKNAPNPNHSRCVGSLLCEDWLRG